MDVAALYVDPCGVYADVPGVDLWGEERDARLYDGPYPVVAHPPCARWCQLAPLVQHTHGYLIGDDGGCFEAALAAVRRFGGVLEHPAYTLAWREFGLPRPAPYVWSCSMLDVGWVTHFEQAAYGVTARKATWLYAVRCELPSLRRPGARVDGGWWVQGRRKHAATGRLRDAKASATPAELRDVLLTMARTAKPHSPRTSGEDLTPDPATPRHGEIGVSGEAQAP